MKLSKAVISIFIAIICLPSLRSYGQSADEVSLLRSINPRYPSNFTFKTLSSTTYPVAMAIPLGMMAVSLMNDNKKGQENSYELAAGLAITAVGTEALKVLINRKRPYQSFGDIYPDQVEDGHSFPSGHTSIAFATATSLTLLSKKWYIGVPVFAWASAVGYSRLYLGQHYPSDVAAGALVGAASAYAAHWLNRKFFFGKKKKVAIKG
jgi:undecaprenyl-diphosphatase